MAELTPDGRAETTQINANGQSSAAQGSKALTFFNDFEARTVESIAEHIIPGEGPDAGASQAGVVYYIDRTIAGFSQNLQRIYRLGLRELDAFCDERYAAHYVDLVPERQDEVVELWLGPATGEPSSGLMFGPDDVKRATEGNGSTSGLDRKLLQRLFAVIREHTVEGYFCDPVYGGNRDSVGWRLVGFPGAYWGYTAKEMKAGFDGRSIPIQTLSDLRAQVMEKTLPPNARFYEDVEE